MLKKKSYMNINNILNEDAISSFLKGLFTGKSSASEKKLRKNIEKDVDKMNKNFKTAYDILNKRRKKQGLKPLSFKKISAHNIVKKYT